MISFPPSHTPPRRALKIAVIAVLGSVAWIPAISRGQESLVLPTSGETKLWHKLTFDFPGPETSESATPNPFTDYRVDVTFSHAASGKIYRVPGYYAADGDAANTSASSGNVWRAHFAADEVGEWSYAVSFRTGANVAMSDDPVAGTSAGHFDSQSGSFQIDPSDKTGRDFRSKGRLQYVGKHHLRFAGTGEYFMKAGTDSPENLLAYADFDGDFKTDGEKDELIKQWLPHVGDWQEGDPVWQGTKGKGLIGAINYLASEGLNAFSFLTMDIEGDDRNVFPYTTYGERLRMDVSRLDQWEIVFEHGTRKGMYLHVKTQETENERLLDSGNVGDQRKLYYRELIARFSHHLALNWNLGEEINDASLAQRTAWAQYFYDHDPYRHHIVIHNGSSHMDMMGPGTKVTGMSRQMNEANFSDTFYQIARYVRNSIQQGKPWVVACDEPGNSSTSLRPDHDPGASHVDARKDALWATILAGGAGCEFYFGYNYPNSDLTCQDFRSRDAFWDYCRYSLEFFQQNPVSFELMTNRSELVSGAGTETQRSDGTNGNRCLARIGHSYLVHLRSGGSHTLNLSGASGEFTVKWFNPRTGGAVIDGAPLTGGGVVALGSPPASPGEDWIVLVQSTTGGSGTNKPPVVAAGPDQSEFMADGTVTLLLEGTVSDDGLPDEFSLQRTWSRVSGPGEVVFENPSAASTRASFFGEGTYVVRLAASDSDLGASDELTVEIKYPASTGRRVVSPSHDASTDDGFNNNGTLLRVGFGERITYLQFDLTTLNAVPLDAVLRLTEGEGLASGPVTLRLFATATHDWTEETITGSNPPQRGAELATWSGEVGAGAVVNFPLGGHVTGPGIYSFILERDSMDKGMAFASDEHPVIASRPLLEMTVSGNSPPVISGQTLLTEVNQPVVLPYSQLLADAFDPDGDPVTLRMIDGSSTGGGEIVMGVDSLTYMPSIDFTGPDSFALTAQDGRGGFSSAGIVVHVTPPLAEVFGKTPKIQREGEGEVRIQFQGLRGLDHRIQRSTDLEGWITVMTINGGETGFIDYLDPESPPGQAFYRVAGP